MLPLRGSAGGSAADGARTPRKSRRHYGCLPIRRGLTRKSLSARQNALVAELNRRSVLRMAAGASAGAVGVFGLSALLDPLKPLAAPQAPVPFEPPSAGSTLPTKMTGSFISAARGGVKTNWVIALPPGQTKMLRPVIALHGKDGDANMMIDVGVEDALAQLVKDGKPPFAVVGVDGGPSSYWHRRSDGTDSGTMVLEELLPMLAAMGMDTSRVGFMGWSMGGYGALLLGARLGPGRTAGICAISPALYMSYLGSATGAFDSIDDWNRNTVFGLPVLNQIPMRIDCGIADRFFFSSTQFVSQLRKKPAGSFSPGGHDVDYWRQQLPGELAWMAS